LFTDRNQSLATLADGWLRRERDYLVLRGEVSLYIRTVERDLVLTIPGGPDRIFQLRLPQNPASSEGFGAWRSVDVIGEPEGARRPPGPDDDFEIRYRVERND
jgi:hypothetical protein